MALYYFIASQPDTIGGITSQVTVQSPNAVAIDFNTFQAKASSDGHKLDQINILCPDGNTNQLSQPVVLNFIDQSGTQRTINYVPILDLKNYVAQVKDFDLSEQFQFNGLSSINYTVLPDANVQLTFVSKKPGKKVFFGDLSEEESSMRESCEPDEMKKIRAHKQKVIADKIEAGEIKQIKRRWTGDATVLEWMTDAENINRLHEPEEFERPKLESIKPYLYKAENNVSESDQNKSSRFLMNSMKTHHIIGIAEPDEI
jgi:hypothetical protein